MNITAILFWGGIAVVVVGLGGGLTGLGIVLLVSAAAQVFLP
jgi:hypothetical protein